MQVRVAYKDNKIICTPDNIKPKRFPEILKVGAGVGGMVAYTNNIGCPQILLGKIPAGYLLLSTSCKEIVFVHPDKTYRPRRTAHDKIAKAKARVAARGGIIDWKRVISLPIETGR